VKLAALARPVEVITVVYPTGYSAACLNVLEKGHGECWDCGAAHERGQLYIRRGTSRRPQCHLCYRTRQILEAAAYSGQAVPKEDWLRISLTVTNSCYYCLSVMDMIMVEDRGNVKSLHHAIDGSFKIICLSCNSSLKTGRDDYNPRTHFNCSRCDGIFTRAEESDNSSRCNSCHSEYDRSRYEQHKQKELVCI
jgi:transposase-like protein